MGGWQNGGWDVFSFASNPASLKGNFGVYNVVTDYGADPTGAVDASLIITNAHKAVSNAGGGILYFPPGVYRLISAGSGLGLTGSNVTWRGAGMFVSILRQDVTSGSAASIISTSTGGVSGWTSNLNFEDLWFDWQQGVGGDTRAGNCAAVALAGCKNFGVRRCRFTRGPAQYIGVNPAAEGLIEYNLFEDYGKPHTLGIDLNGACSRTKVRFNRFRYLNEGIQLTGGTAGVAPVELIDINDNDFDLGWNTSVQLLSGSGATVSYTNTVLTDTAANFTGLSTSGNQFVRIMPQLAQNSGVAVTYDALTLTDTSAPFTTSWPQGSLVRTADGRFGIVKNVDSTSVIRVEEWLSDTDRTFATPPGAGQQYTVYNSYILVINAFTTTTITTTLPQGIVDRNGVATTPAAQTRYELLPVQGSYPIYVSGNCRDIGIVRNRILRAYGDGIEMSVLSTRCTITDNFVYDGRDTGIYLQGTNHIAKGNTCLHMGKIGIGHFGSDHLTEANHCYDSGWIGPGGSDFYFLGAVRCRVIGNDAQRINNNSGGGTGFYEDAGAANDSNTFIGNGSRNHQTSNYQIVGGNSTNAFRWRNRGTFDATWPELQTPAMLTGQIAAVGNLTTLTVPNDGAKHVYFVSGTIRITTLGSGNIQLQVQYTDSNGVLQTMTIPLCAQAGAFAASATTADDYKGFVMLTVNPNTSVLVRTAGTFTGCTYNVSGQIDPKGAGD